MSQTTKRKYVIREVLCDELKVPSEGQTVVRVVAGRGNNLHEVEEASGTRYLVSMPTKFRHNFWIKRGDYVLVEPIPEGGKVKAEIVLILTNDHKHFYRTNGCWPKEFDPQPQEQSETDLFVNANRPQVPSTRDSSSSDSNNEESEESDAETESDSDTNTQEE